MLLFEIGILRNPPSIQRRQIPGSTARAWVILASLRCGLVLLPVMLLIVGEVARAEMTYDRHVFFDNSLPDRSYYQSQGMVIAPSQLELFDGKFPVDADHFVSPPNGLRLKWKSAPGGEWRMKLKSMARYGRNLEFEGDTLAVWCFSEKPMSPDESPRINLQDRSGTGSGTTTFLASHGPLTAGKWVRVNIPLSSFKNLYPSTEDLKFDPGHLESIWFVQGLDDGKEHTLYLDDFRLCHRDRLDSEPPVAPTGLSVKAFERHVDLTWAANREEDFLGYKIYRSTDGEKYVPVGVQRNQLNRAVDFVGEPGRKVFFRLSALDLSGNESALSPVVSASTRPFKDEELQEMVQEASFRYYWEGAHPNAGMAIEILPGDENLVAVGASGFGIMALIVGAERQFVTRDQCAGRLLKIVRFLNMADRFHGVWPHFLDGKTGKITPYFGKYDNGGDLVETAFLVQGLLVARQYFDRDTETEREIRQTITKLWREVEWDWYRKDSASECLYWHWSPDHGWYLSHPLVGWNETMIVYLLAIASPTHAVPASLYHSGWAGQSDRAVRYRQNWSRTTQGDHYTNGNSYYGFKLDVGEGSGADLFFTQFSFMGFDPRGKKDRYTNYDRNNRNIALINHAYCADNPRKHLGYGADCWGLSAGINSGGGRPLPRDDNGTICISASLGSFPYTPKESMTALRHFYRDLGAKAYGIYGFHDGFNQTENWFEGVWMGLNQGTITVMIENYRTGLVWSKFMANPEIQPALERIGFRPDADSHAR
jgi:exo beta-1,2-glucooligosaccharide sophorohydrolase (non-reducing end)